MTFSRIRGSSADDKMIHPNHIIYQKMENLVNQMLNSENGVPIKTVKSFLSKIPSVFTGQDIVAWLLRNVDIADLGDALHLAHLLASHGYVFQIDDHVLTVKNDGTYYRFQTPYFWPSNCWEPENTDYAVYLCKRTMQNKAHLELEDFEAENLAKLQKMFSRKWEFVFMQAEAQYKVDKKRDRQERQILDSQERAFWDVHRPVPGCVNTTEIDFRKLSRSGRPKYSASNNTSLNSAYSNGPDVSLISPAAASAAAVTLAPSSLTPAAAVAASAQTADVGGDNAPTTSAANAAPATRTPATSHRDGTRGYHHRPGFRRYTHIQDSLKYEIGVLQSRLAKNVLKTSKVIENYLHYFEHRRDFDAFLVTLGGAADPFLGHPNPWISDTVDFWQHDKITGEISARRVKLWEESFEELLADQWGRETLQRFLDKEYSGENLRFWWEVQKLRKCSCRMVPVLVTEIYNEFIAPNATSPVNIDCKVMEITEENLKNSNRYSFDEAADHIYCLMKNDSYQRFLRSDIYRDLANMSKKKAASKMTQGLRFPNLTSFVASSHPSKRDNAAAAAAAASTSAAALSTTGSSPSFLTAVAAPPAESSSPASIGIGGTEENNRPAAGGSGGSGGVVRWSVSSSSSPNVRPTSASMYQRSSRSSRGVTSPKPASDTAMAADPPPAAVPPVDSVPPPQSASAKARAKFLGSSGGSRSARSFSTSNDNY